MPEPPRKKARTDPELELVDEDPLVETPVVYISLIPTYYPDEPIDKDNPRDNPSNKQ